MSAKSEHKKTVGTQEDIDIDRAIREVIQSLYDEGLVVKVLDDKGRPELRLGPLSGELQQAYKLRDFATPEELVFWRNEHPVN